MFTPSELERMPVELEKRMSELENKIMEDIIRRIRINDKITRSADWQIYRLIQMGQSTEYIKEQIKETLKLTDESIDNLYEDAIQSGYNRDKEVYDKVNREFTPFKENTELQQTIQAVIKQTIDQMSNITQTLGFVQDAAGKRIFTPLAEYLQKTLDTAVLEVASGNFDYNTTLRKVVKEMTKSGLRTVDYASGLTNRIEVAVRRALMTGVTQVTGKINEMNAKELDTEYFEISWHATARPTHQVWQGRVYSKKELQTVCGLGTAAGLLGANCYHSYYPFIPGVSERTYTDEQLDEMNQKENEKKEYNGKEVTSYEATQHQRRLETIMRAQRSEIKLLEKGEAAEDDIINARARYRSTSAQYVDFSKNMNLPQQRERVYMDGLKNIGVGKYKVPLNDRNHDAIMKIQEHIKSSNQIKTIDVGKQNKHIVGTHEYKRYVDNYNKKNEYGPSRLGISIEKAQALINQYHGTGKIKVTKNGWNNEEVILNNDINIGTAVNNRNGVEAPTTVFKIKYSEKGTHIVPDYPSKKEGKK
jgi:hypothetical protein